MRFPTRTLVLMVLTLIAFGWFYWQTHANRPSSPSPPRARLASPPDAGPALRN